MFFLIYFALILFMENNYETERCHIQEKINKLRYGSMKITDNDLKCSILHPISQKTTFKNFPEDFYSIFAMKYKEDIENHPFFAKLSQLPKGALLHNHLYNSIDTEWFLKLLNDPNVYEDQIETLEGLPIKILIYNKNPTNLTKMIDIKAEYIKNHSHIPELDLNKSWELEIKRKLSIYPDEMEKITNNDQAWALFMPKMLYGLRLIRFKENYFQHIMNVFNQCIQDKIYRFETRINLGQVRDENYSLISLDEEMQIYLKALKIIRDKTPIFSFGIIVEFLRKFNDSTIHTKMNEAFKMKEKYSELIIGLDFDGDENNFRSFHNLSNVIIKTKEELEKKFEIKLPLILHCGESLKFSNENPIDGFLLNSKRFGHGLNLLKFPYLFDLIKKNDICIEVNPISNQILKNTIDLRWHPAITYLGLGIKIAISNDDPTIYNTRGVNYDIFVATAAFELNVIDLKKIFLNSLECSMMQEKEKEEMIASFMKEWDEIIEQWIKI